MTLYAYLQALGREQPNKRLLGDESRWLSASEVLRLVTGLAHRFVGLGLRPGDEIALRAPRCLETALLLFALRAAGLLVVLTDPRQEIDEVLAGCEAGIQPRARITSVCRDGFALQMGSEQAFISFDSAGPNAALPEMGPKNPAFVIFTSGSTGKSKAVVISEHNLIMNLIDTKPLGLYSKEDIALGALPLDHVFGLVLLAGTAVLEYAEFFPEKTDVPSLLACVAGERITRMNGVPSLYLAMAERSADYDLSSLRAGLIAGGPVTAEQFCRIERELDMTLISVYGMSECVGITCSSWRDPQAVRAAGVGPVYPMNTIRLVDPEGRELPLGEIGEIEVRSPFRMLGYYGCPMPEDAFFATGDLGRLDENGVLHLCGRKKEIIIRNGNNLSPRRIEDALLSLPGVKAAVVIGLPDERQGEVPCAMIVGTAQTDELRPLLHKNELPVGILSVDELPMTASGKPDKQRIREVLQAWRNS